MYERVKWPGCGAFETAAQAWQTKYKKHHHKYFYYKIVVVCVLNMNSFEELFPDKKCGPMYSGMNPEDGYPRQGPHLELAGAVMAIQIAQAGARSQHRISVSPSDLSDI